MDEAGPEAPLSRTGSGNRRSDAQRVTLKRLEHMPPLRVTGLHTIVNAVRLPKVKADMLARLTSGRVRPEKKTIALELDAFQGKRGGRPGALRQGFIQAVTLDKLRPGSMPSRGGD